MRLKNKISQRSQQERWLKFFERDFCALLDFILRRAAEWMEDMEPDWSPVR